MKTIEEQLEEANAKLAAAEEKLANVKEFTLQDAAKLIKERDGVVFLNQAAYKDAISKEKGSIDVDAIRNAERRHMTEILAAAGIDIPEKIPNENEDGKAQFKDVLKFAKAQVKDLIAELKSKAGTTEEKSERLAQIEKELQDTKSNYAKALKDLTLQSEQSVSLKKAIHNDKVDNLVKAVVAKKIEKYTFPTERAKQLYAKEIEAEVRSNFETELDEDASLRVYERFVDTNGKEDKALTKSPSDAIGVFIEKSEIFKELATTAKTEEKQAAKTTQKPVQSSKDKEFNPLSDGGETPQDSWLKKINELNLPASSFEALSLKESFGILTEADKQMLSYK